MTPVLEICLAITKQGLSARQVAILTHLAGGETKLSAIAQAVGITPSAMTGSMDNLARKGFIQRACFRSEDTDDRRITPPATLTRKAQDALTRICRVIEATRL